MNQVFSPAYLQYAFFGVVVLTFFILLLVVRGTIKGIWYELFRVGIVAWLIVQVFLSLKGIYFTEPDAMPPRILLLGILPPVVLVILLFLTRKGRWFIDQLPLKFLTWLHVVRIPVEIVLYGLFLNQAVPRAMTFEGRNFDILAGFTAPLVAYFGIGRKKMGRTALLAWNFICLGLLLNIVVTAILSAPTPMQQLGYEQPNVAILVYPYSLLPSFVVPAVLSCHLISIRKLLRKGADFV